MKINLLAILSLILAGPTALAQGCSDAGFCSLGVLKNNSLVGSKKTSLAVGFNYGAGEQKTSTINPYIEYSVSTGKRLSYQLKLTSVYATGFLGSTFNAGDIFGYVTYSGKPTSVNKLSILSGIKIPLSYSNDKNEEGKPLPLDYQSSIGTFDLVEGINYVIQSKWELNAGIQVPVIQKNKNTFFPDEYSDPRVNEFSPTNNFRRKGDALLRVGRYLHFKKAAITLKPNLLAIYHLGDDTYENRLGKRETIENSAGLTVNGGLIATKTFRKNNNQLELFAATPFVVRESRPDGLTRSFVFNIQYRFYF